MWSCARGIQWDTRKVHLRFCLQTQNIHPIFFVRKNKQIEYRTFLEDPVKCYPFPLNPMLDIFEWDGM